MAASGRKFLLAIGLILGCTGQEVKVSAPAANGGIGDTTSSGGGKAITLSVTPSLATISVNATVQLMGILRDTLGGALGDLITWSTSNSAVATVNSSGLVTGTGVGTTTINAAGDGAAAISTITVTNVPVATVTVAPALDTLQVGLNQQLTAT